MIADDRSPGRSPPRFCLFAAAVILLVGCGIVALVPVDESHDAPTALRFSSDHTPYRTSDVIFSHAIEAHAGEPCSTCHFGTASQESTGVPTPGAARADRPRVENVLLPSMATCFRCHDGTSVSNDCITCHLTNRKDRKPGFHDGLFPRHHREMADAEEYKCALCHIQGDCKGCHAERKPLSHTPRFERSTHGRFSTHDRRSCATCHETAFCENCHMQPPPDHTPAFMAGGAHKQAALVRGGRSCLVCHSFEDVCAGCHR